MKEKLFQNIAIKRLCTFFHAAQGIAAMEFALIAPIFIVFFFGIVELSTAYMARTKAAAAAASVADLVAQSTTPLLEKTEMDNIFSAAQTLMEPYKVNDRLSVSITSVTMQENTKTNKIETEMISAWHNKNGTLPLRLRGKIPASAPSGFIPNDILESGASLIVVESEYKYPILLNFFIKKEIKMKNKYYFTPRYGVPLKFES